MSDYVYCSDGAGHCLMCGYPADLHVPVADDVLMCPDAPLADEPGPPDPDALRD